MNATATKPAPKLAPATPASGGCSCAGCMKPTTPASPKKILIGWDG
jgi:hypothetical protein